MIFPSTYSSVCESVHVHTMCYIVCECSRMYSAACVHSACRVRVHHDSICAW